MPVSKIRTCPLIEIADMVNWKRMKDNIARRKKKRELFFQHYTTSTKLYIAKRHLLRLSKIIPNQKATDILNISKKGVKFDGSFLKKGRDYLDELDGIFYSLRSCVDSFLWEINYTFKLGCSRATHVWDEMKKKYPEKRITKMLNNLSKEPWFRYLSDIRNNIAHYTLSEIVTFTEDLKIYLPKNPETACYSREKEFEVIPCLKHLWENAKEFLETGYNILVEELVY